MSGPIAVFGGTFDPPHVGHLVLGECVAEQFGCERVLFIPAGDPYRKTGTDTAENRRAAPAPRRSVTSGALRLELVRAALQGNPRFAPDGREVRRSGPSYTIETLRELHAEGQPQIVLVLGSDAVADLPNWREPEEIQRLARIVVAEKAPGAGAAGFERVEMPFLAVSSTLIRDRVARGRSIRYLVPEAVERLVEKHGLYRSLVHGGNSPAAV
ncbi:MAG: nicotinate (nicotinamide) nucleotide adenylyltransferase [Dehalococcoidia bacterium]|nr:nicotinate (nicotinamide) nucleotide adenylyltransferase [Dehalococcoidia bacterium]